MSLADFVRAARESRGLKKHELAVLAGLSPSYLGRIEAGRADSKFSPGDRFL